MYYIYETALNIGFYLIATSGSSLILLLWLEKSVILSPGSLLQLGNRQAFRRTFIGTLGGRRGARMQKAERMERERVAAPEERRGRSR